MTAVTAAGEALKMHRIVIVGGGIGGLVTATRSGGYRRTVASVMLGLNDNAIALRSAMDACFTATFAIGDLT